MYPIGENCLYIELTAKNRTDKTISMFDINIKVSQDDRPIADEWFTFILISNIEMEPHSEKIFMVKIAGADFLEKHDPKKSVSIEMSYAISKNN